ncbi:MAG: response regulator [Fimbriimonadaceae bacterium]|nr:response regulator [Fimbriimonadaceae bacterium]
MLRAAMEDTEFKLLEAETGAQGLELAARKNPDVILLDLGLPDLDGAEIIQRVREWSQLPILVLSARGQEGYKVHCLEAGADDYVMKPFGIAELFARLRAALRRAPTSSESIQDPVFEHGHLKVDMSARRIEVHGEEVHLTPLEYRLLCTLIRHAGKVVTHRQLLQEVWGPEYADEAQYLRVYMGYLRKKLETGDQKLFLTEPRVGYRLAV